MTKYVIMYDDYSEIIFDTLADAEEYILSIAEEAVYEVFLQYYEPEEWFDRWRLEDLSDVWVGGTGKRQPRQTSYSAMLSYLTEDWQIEETKYMPAN